MYFTAFADNSFLLIQIGLANFVKIVKALLLIAFARIILKLQNILSINTVCIPQKYQPLINFIKIIKHPDFLVCLHPASILSYLIMQLLQMVVEDPRVT